MSAALNEKTVALTVDKMPQISRRLLRLGFNRGDDENLLRLIWQRASSNPQANVRQFVFDRETIDPNGKWIFLTVRAYKPFAFAGTATLKRYAQKRQAELANELRLAKAYWQQTIWPYIESPMPDQVHWYIADAAHARLRQAMGNARHWNATREGRQFPVPEDAFPDLNSDEFHRPELLSKDENLKRTLEGQSPPAGMSPTESIRWTYERQREYESLPEKPGLGGTVALAFRLVTFDQIKRSNETTGQLPLLPPVPADRTARLSNEAIKKIVSDFVRKHAPPSLTQKEYERQQSEIERLTKEREIFRGRTMTYEEWQHAEQREMTDCLKHDRVSLWTLLCLRRERFGQHGHAPELIANIRKPPDDAQENKPAPPEIDATILWHVEQRIRDELDTKLKSAPSASQVFVRYCRDRMKLVEMRKKFGWSERTLKARKAALQSFLQTNFNGLTLDAFFVDRRIFTAAERQLNEEVFRSRCPGNAGKARFQAPNLPEDYRDVGLDSGSGA